MDEYYQIVQRLPASLRQELVALPSCRAKDIQEIRLRAEGGIYFTVKGTALPATEYDASLRYSADLRFTQDFLWSVLVELCGHSLHSYEEQLQQGYITLPGGHRVGIGGRYVKTPLGYTLQSVTTINIRVARHHELALPQKLLSVIEQPFGGLLIVGPPLSGKTTVLRTVATHLGRIGRICTVLDEREELYAPEQDTGTSGILDFISGVEKAQGAQMALRTLSPQVILLDELGDLAEVEMLKQAMFSGVDYIATLHASTHTELECKPQFKLLQQENALKMVWFLAGRSQPGVIKQVRDL